MTHSVFVCVCVCVCMCAARHAGGWERAGTQGAARERERPAAAAYHPRHKVRQRELRVKILGEGADDRDLHAVAAAVLGELGRHLRAREKRGNVAGMGAGQQVTQQRGRGRRSVAFCARGAVRTVIFMWPSVVFQPRTAYADVMS